MTVTEQEVTDVYSFEDFCELCAPVRRSEGLPPHIKVELPNGTLHQNFRVKVCPDCDGEAAQLGTRG